MNTRKKVNESNKNDKTQNRTKFHSVPEPSVSGQHICLLHSRFTQQVQTGARGALLRVGGCIVGWD